MNYASRSLSAVLLAAAVTSSISHAATTTWGGVSGDFLTPANWSGGVAPDLSAGDTAIINSSNAVYNAGPDLTFSSTSVLQINGGSWSQAGADSYIQLSGTIRVNGGTFNMGSSGNIHREPSSVIEVISGTANLNGDLSYNPAVSGAFIFSGGSVNLTGEFKPVATYSLTTGSLSANLISFSDGPGSLNFSGGTITLNGAGINSGFYGGSVTQGLNFTTGSTGTLVFSNYTAAELATDGFLTNGTIQYNGTVNSSQFSVLESGGNVTVTVVPEPSAAALSALCVAGAFLVRRRPLR